MNFYKRHLGDIAKSLTNLSQGQMGAYDLLLDWLYANEKPLPLLADELFRIGRAFSKVERENVTRVLAYFDKTDSGYVQKRALEEIESFNDSQADVVAKRKHEAERKRLYRQRRSALFDALREKGIVPNFNTVNDVLESLLSDGCPTGQDADVPVSVPLSVTAIQNPESRIQKEAITSTDVDVPADPSANHPPSCPQKSIVALYHEMLPELRTVREWNDTRSRMLAKRWKESKDRQTLDWWKGYFSYVKQSDFLMGRVTGSNGRAFDCDLEWLISPKNFLKVIEGKYE